jgi:hypothetical protein
VTLPVPAPDLLTDPGLVLDRVSLAPRGVAVLETVPERTSSGPGKH